MLKNVTFSADAELIRRARDKASKEKTTLNDTFRRWLARYARGGSNATEYDDIMGKLNYVTPGERFSREEMNER
jgi:hypothetical protein